METSDQDSARVAQGDEIQRKLRLSMDLLAFAYTVKLHQLALKHPGFSETQLKALTWQLIEKGSR